jgi:CheY-like chemotaxis protein
VSFDSFLKILMDAGFDVDADGILDALWLASLGRTFGLPSDVIDHEPKPKVGQRPLPEPKPELKPPDSDTSGSEVLNERRHKKTGREPDSDTAAASSSAEVFPLGEIGPEDRTVSASRTMLPGARTLPERLQLARALRPLRRRWRSAQAAELDEDATAELTANLRLAVSEGVFPVVRSKAEPWYDAHLVHEDDPAIELWASPLREFVQVLRETGAFRLVRSWRLRLNPTSAADIARARLENPAGTTFSTRVLGGDHRQLVLFASHGASVHWADGVYTQLLRSWSLCSVVVLHLLPRPRWRHELLGEPNSFVRTLQPGSPSIALEVKTARRRFGPEAAAPGVVCLPVAPLEARALGTWARMQMGLGQGSEAFLIDPADALSADELAEYCRATPDPALALTNLRERSPDAFELAMRLALSPFTLPVARLVQEAMGSTDFTLLADVMLSGIVVARRGSDAVIGETTYYEIHEAARPHLRRSMRRADVEDLVHELQNRVSAHLGKITGRSVSFAGLVADPRGIEVLPDWVRAFARFGMALSRQIRPRKPTSERWSYASDPDFTTADATGARHFRPEVASELADRLSRRPYLGLRILWVDNHPREIRQEVAHLEALGASIDQAANVNGAFDALTLRLPDLLISDMVQGGQRTGVRLLDGVRERGLSLPTIIYTSRASTDRRNAAIAAGAIGCVDTPTKLYDLIQQAVLSLPRLASVEASPDADPKTGDVVRPRRWAISVVVTPDAAPVLRRDLPEGWNQVAVVPVDRSGRVRLNEELRSRLALPSTVSPPASGFSLAPVVLGSQEMTLAFVVTLAEPGTVGETIAGNLRRLLSEYSKRTRVRIWLPLPGREGDGLSREESLGFILIAIGESGVVGGTDLHLVISTATDIDGPELIGLRRMVERAAGRPLHDVRAALAQAGITGPAEEIVAFVERATLLMLRQLPGRDNGRVNTRVALLALLAVSAEPDSSSPGYALRQAWNRLAPEAFDWGRVTTRYLGPPRTPAPEDPGPVVFSRDFAQVLNAAAANANGAAVGLFDIAAVLLEQSASRNAVREWTGAGRVLHDWNIDPGALRDRFRGTSTRLGETPIRPTVFISYADEDAYWKVNFTHRYWFGDLLGNVRIVDLQIGYGLQFAPVDDWLRDRSDAVGAILVILSKQYITKASSLSNWWRGSSEANRRRLFLLPVIIDADARAWWVEQKLRDLGDDYAYVDFTQESKPATIISSTGPVDAVTTKISELARLIRDHLEDQGQRASSSVKPPARVSSKRTIVVLGHPSAIATGEVDEMTRQLTGDLKRLNLEPINWGDGWRAPSARRGLVALQKKNPLFVQPLGPADAGDYAGNPGPLRKWLESAIASDFPEDVVGSSSLLLVLWLPGHPRDPAFEAALAGGPPDENTVLRHEDPVSFATWLSHQVDTADTMTMLLEEVPNVAASAKLRAALHDGLYNIVETVVYPPPERWFFSGNMLVEQLRSLDSDRAIIAIHDLNTATARDWRSARREVERKMNSIEQALRSAGRTDLAIFRIVLLVRKADALPWVKYPSPSQFEGWHLLPFGEKNNDLAPKATQASVVRTYLKDWLGDSARKVAGDDVDTASRLAQLEQQVCRIADENAPIGVGLLIYPDLVLTTAEAVRAAGGKRVTCIFGTQGRGGDTLVSADDVIADKSDFGFIKLAEPVRFEFVDPFEHNFPLAVSPPATGTAGAELRILSVDRAGRNIYLSAVVSRQSADPARLYYRITARNPDNSPELVVTISTGSPIFDAENLVLVGVHRGGIRSGVEGLTMEGFGDALSRVRARVSPRARASARRPTSRSVATRYVQELSKILGYLAAWPPTLHLRLGDIGVLTKSAFTRISSLEELGINFTTVQGDENTQIQYNPPEVTISRDRRVDVGRLRMSISFGRADAVFFAASDCVFSRIADLDFVAEMIMTRHARGEWEKAHVIISELVTAGTMTALISGSASAQIDLLIEGSGFPSLATLKSDDVIVQNRSHGHLTVSVIGAKGVTPLFRVGEVRQSLLARRARFVVRPEPFVRPQAS